MDAAEVWVSWEADTIKCCHVDIPVLIEAEKAEQLPNPVRKQNNESNAIPSDPCPWL